MTRLIPKLVICLREGYSARLFGRDLLSGVTVGIIALPLAMAFGIASIPESVAAELSAISPSLTPPALGLYTAIIAGFLISALGGSRFQIGGPTGAFIVIVYRIAADHGYAGLATATAMAGVIIILLGVMRLGRMIKYIPYPVTTGFTSGIAVVIAMTQVKDFLGLSLVSGEGSAVPLPPDFVPKVITLAEFAHTFDGATLAVGAASLVGLILIRRFVPRLPGPIVVTILASLVVAVGGITVETIGTRFGGIPRSLAAPHLPAFHPQLIRDLIPEATTIAILCAIESLLSAVVADGMTGWRHRSDVELIGQGVANIASACFWGIPATGAIARTVANIRSGAATPISGMIHAVTLLLFMLVAAPLAKAIPLATLSAVLLMVAWNMSEVDHFRSLLRSPRSDVLVLMTTFGLTVFTDLTISVTVGMVLASMLFMRRMTEIYGLRSIKDELDNGEEDDDSFADLPPLGDLHAGLEIYEINGPFFFGVADRLKDTLALMERPPHTFILRMRHVPAIDSTGLHALEEFHAKCSRGGTRLVLSGVQPMVRSAMEKIGLASKIGPSNLCATINEAIKSAGVSEG